MSKAKVKKQKKIKRGKPELSIVSAPPKPAMTINTAQLSGSNRFISPFVAPTVAPGVIPDRIKMAMDEAMNVNYNYTANSAFQEGLGFLGYPYLAELTQRPEYRTATETIAKEMTRNWLELISTGDDKQTDKTDKLKAIEAELVRLKAREMFSKVCEHDNYFGRGQLFLDMGNTENTDELSKPLTDTPGKIGKNGIKQLILVDPMWTYPNTYNSINPLLPDYFVPKTWFVMGTQVHASRFMFFISKTLPDILKPAYAFGGLSLTQVMKPYVDNWLRTRQSVSDAVHTYSVSVLGTDLSSILNGGSTLQMYNRVQLFNEARDNRGLMVIDKNAEALTNVQTSLTTLDKLQAQAQEQLASVTGIPLVKLLGITPSGLNASSDGEIRVFYDKIHAQQEADFTPHMTRLINIIQLSLFGSIDKEISFKWNSLWELDETELSAIHKTEADTAAVLINAGVISPAEERQRLATEKDSVYASLDMDVEELPESPQDKQLSHEADQSQVMLKAKQDADKKAGNKPMAKDEGEAEDSSHWITLEGGQHVLIDGDGQVVSGAGGNMNYTYLPNVKSKSDDIEIKVSNNLTNKQEESKLSSTSQSETANEGRKMENIYKGISPIRAPKACLAAMEKINADFVEFTNDDNVKFRISKKGVENRIDGKSDEGEVYKLKGFIPDEMLYEMSAKKTDVIELKEGFGNKVIYDLKNKQQWVLEEDNKTETKEKTEALKKQGKMFRDS